MDILKLLNNRYVKLVGLSVLSAAVTVFVDDLRADDIAERAAEKAVKKLDKKNDAPVVYKNRAQRRAERRR